MLGLGGGNTSWQLHWARTIGFAPAAPGSSGRSATMASAVIMRLAIELASTTAVRTTLAGSMIPASIMFTYSPVWAL